LKESTLQIAEVLSNFRTHQQGLRRALEGLDAQGVSDVVEVGLPSLKAGKAATFSYNATYPRPIEKDMTLSYLSLGDSRGCMQNYLGTTGSRGFVLTSTSPLPRVTLRIRANQSLRVLPYLQAPGTDQLLSMPFIPLGILNFIDASPDG